MAKVLFRAVLIIMVFTLVKKRLLCLCKDIFILQLRPASLYENKYYNAREIIMPTSIERWRFGKHLDQGIFVAKVGLPILSITVRRKMFAINNFCEFRKWSTFANIISHKRLCSHIHSIYIYIYIYLCTHYYNYGGVTLRWQTSMEALCLVKPSSGRSSMGS